LERFEIFEVEKWNIQGKKIMIVIWPFVYLKEMEALVPRVFQVRFL
jgi:hypothetical protein